MAVPLDWTSKAVWLFTEVLVSLIMRALPVPALERAREVVALLTKLKAMLLPLEVRMELPPLYADCKVIVLAEHFVTLLDESIHNALPAAAGVSKPFKVRKELLAVLVLTVTPLPVEGEKVDCPCARKSLSEAIVAPPLKVA